MARGRFFDVRDSFGRMLLVDASGVAYLLLIERETGQSPTGTQWLLAVCAFTAALLLHRRPPVNLLVQTVLFAVSLRVLDDPTISQVGTAWALGEMAIWAPARRYLWGSVAAVAVVYLAFQWPAPVGFSEGLAGLCINLGLPVLIGTVMRNSRELAVQAEHRAIEEQRRHESEQRAARADERSAIARELHDVIAHHVASMVLRVGVAQHVLPGVDPKVAAVFDDVHRTGTSALADLRRLVAVLRDPDRVRADASLTAIDPAALPAALDGAVETARRGGVIVEAEIDPAIGAVDAVRGLAVLRLTQEALTNVAKHAGTTPTARLRVTVDGSDVQWEVADDGGAAGVPVPAGIPPGGGHGLTGMRERVEVLGGALTAGPAGRGWRVATTLPGETA